LKKNLQYHWLKGFGNQNFQQINEKVFNFTLKDKLNATPAPIWLADPKVQYPQLLEQKTCDMIAKLPSTEMLPIDTLPAVSENIHFPTVLTTQWVIKLFDVCC
jgi:hypothetical protein